MQVEKEENKIEKVINILGQKFCVTLVKRIICVILIAFEIDKNIIAEKVNISLKSVKKYENMLNKGKVNEILTIKGSSRKSELEDYKEEIFAELDAGEYKTLRQIKAMILAKTGLNRSRNSINLFLKKTNIVRSK